MSLRISSALVALGLLAACDAASDTAMPSPPAPGDEVECAIGTGASLSPVCSLEAIGNDVIIHHPDGGFRRLIRDPATGALSPRDGADPLVPEQGAPDTLGFAIGTDRYRIARRLLEPSPQPQPQ